VPPQPSGKSPQAAPAAAQSSGVQPGVVVEVVPGIEVVADVTEVAPVPVVSPPLAVPSLAEPSLLVGFAEVSELALLELPVLAETAVAELALAEVAAPVLAPPLSPQAARIIRNAEQVGRESVMAARAQPRIASVCQSRRRLPTPW
jgi:hypothetical protein